MAPSCDGGLTPAGSTVNGAWTGCRPKRNALARVLGRRSRRTPWLAMGHRVLAFDQTIDGIEQNRQTLGPYLGVGLSF